MLFSFNWWRRCRFVRGPVAPWPLTGVGRPWPPKREGTLPRGPLLEKQWPRRLSGCGHGCLSLSSTQMWSWPKNSRGSNSLDIPFPLYLTLAWVILHSFCFYGPILLSRGTLITRKEKKKKMVRSQTKLSFIASTLTYPYWRNVPALKLALWHGYSETARNRTVFVWGICYLFKSLLFEMANPLLIMFCFYSVYYQNYTPPASPPGARFIYQRGGPWGAGY